MKSLKDIIPVRFDSDQMDLYDREVQRFHVDSSLPPQEGIPINKWWPGVMTKYPTLGVVVEGVRTPGGVIV